MLLPPIITIPQNWFSNCQWCNHKMHSWEQPMLQTIEPRPHNPWWHHQMDTFSRFLALCETHKGKWRWTLMFSLICTRTNVSVNNWDACDLIRHRAHYDVTWIPIVRAGCCWYNKQWMCGTVCWQVSEWYQCEHAVEKFPAKSTDVKWMSDLSVNNEYCSIYSSFNNVRQAIFFLGTNIYRYWIKYSQFWMSLWLIMHDIFISDTNSNDLNDVVLEYDSHNTYHAGLGYFQKNFAYVMAIDYSCHLSNAQLGTNSNEIWIRIQNNSFENVFWKKVDFLSQPQCVFPLYGITMAQNEQLRR